MRLSLRRFAPADSVKVWNVFLPKPDVPPAIAANYRDVKVEWTKQLVAEQRQKTERIEKETEKMKAILVGLDNKASLGRAKLKLARKVIEPRLEFSWLKQNH